MLTISFIYLFDLKWIRRIDVKHRIRNAMKSHIKPTLTKTKHRTIKLKYLSSCEIESLVPQHHHHHRRLPSKDYQLEFIYMEVGTSIGNELAFIIYLLVFNANKLLHNIVAMVEWALLLDGWVWFGSVWFGLRYIPTYRMNRNPREIYILFILFLNQAFFCHFQQF